MIFAWWMAVLADGYSSAYFRKKPTLSVLPFRENPLTDSSSRLPSTGTMMTMILISIRPPQSPLRTRQMTPRGSHRIGNILKYVINICQQKPFVPDIPPVSFWYNAYPLIYHATSETFWQGYYRANHALARIARQISKLFWKPLIELDGIPLDTLQTVMDLLYDWKGSFLQHVGASAGPKGDFIGAISACWSIPPPSHFIPNRLTFRPGATDATYHVMWVIVFDAVDDFGIKEVNDIIRNHNPDLGQPQIPSHMDEVKVRVFDEALRGASRIAGLVSSRVLTPPLPFIFQLDWCFGIEPISGQSCRRITHKISCLTS